jgi:hypothetical protein
MSERLAKPFRDRLGKIVVLEMKGEGYIVYTG